MHWKKKHVCPALEAWGGQQAVALMLWHILFLAKISSATLIDVNGGICYVLERMPKIRVGTFHG